MSFGDDPFGIEAFAALVEPETIPQVPTISLADVIDIGTTSARPQVVVTF